MSRAMTGAVIGRDLELASIGELLVKIEGGPVALVLSGEAGIGKTALWEAGVARADRAGVRVLSCRCAEGEASLAFGGLSDLLGAVFPQLAAALAPPRRHALEVALLLREPDSKPLDERAVSLALLDSLRLLADDGAVLVAVDDLQWLDASSARVLQMSLRRLQGQRVGLLATLREGEKRATVGFERVFAAERLVRRRLGPLSLAGLHHLLRDRVGLELARPELVRLREVTGGNPLYALELGRELLRTGRRPAAGGMLPVPESLSALVGARLARLPEAGDALLLAAALARPSVEVIVAAQGERAPALQALEAALREGVIEVEDSRVRFAHPLLASVCYQQAPIWRRRAVHRALAAVVGEAEERAHHLALAADGPDAAVAAAVEGAAEAAAGRGATPAAAELCELAAELTRSDGALARGRLLRAAELHRRAGSIERAAAMLEQLLPSVEPGTERADVLVVLATTVSASPARAIELLSEALENVPGNDERSSRILSWRAWLRQVSGAELAEALADGRAAAELAERVGDSEALAMAIAQQGAVETWTNEITPGLLEDGVDIEARLPRTLDPHHSPRFVLARRLWRQGRLDDARAILEELMERADDPGEDDTPPLVVHELSMVEWFAGRWERALELAEIACAALEQTKGRGYHVWGLCEKSMLETDLGLVEEARATAGDAIAVAHALCSTLFVGLCHGALGRLEFALGDLDAAAAHFARTPHELELESRNDPTDPVWSDAIATLIARGQVGRARAHLDRQEALARRFEGPWALAAAARGRGLVALAEGDLDTAFAAFDESLAFLGAVPFPFERARTLLCLGLAHRKAKRKRAARESLEEALAAFEHLGARLWADRAHAELGRISGRRTSGNLTETERRVAELAAQGYSNKEIASALFVSEHTVAAHLTHVYRKLGVRSRSALGHTLAVGSEASFKT
jgi:DNA-binding CsgD family transcriptional regulator